MSMTATSSASGTSRRGTADQVIYHHYDILPEKKGPTTLLVRCVPCTTTVIMTHTCDRLDLADPIDLLVCVVCLSILLGVGSEGAGGGPFLVKVDEELATDDELHHKVLSYIISTGERLEGLLFSFFVLFDRQTEEPEPGMWATNASPLLVADTLRTLYISF